jgi:hypothetical protein
MEMATLPCGTFIGGKTNAELPAVRHVVFGELKRPATRAPMYRGP